MTSIVDKQVMKSNILMKINTIGLGIYYLYNEKSFPIISHRMAAYIGFIALNQCLNTISFAIFVFNGNRDYGLK